MLTDLQALPRNHPKCLFYSGTESFRARSYASASASWQALVRLEEVPVDLEHYRTDAYNNLGYLYFMGWGVRKNRDRAIDYWKYATKLGHEESAYHLCHVYGESEEPTYNPSVALGYCRESLRQYMQSVGKRKEAEEVIAQLNRYIAGLEAK
jgi:TPR repeat protein